MSKPGKELWTQPLGTSQKAPPVMADGKIFVGTENGKFFIVRPHADRAEILSEVELPISKNSIGGSEGTAEQVFGGAAISRGRIFFVTTDAVYAIGPKQRKTLTGLGGERAGRRRRRCTGLRAGGADGARDRARPDASS